MNEFRLKKVAPVWGSVQLLHQHLAGSAVGLTDDGEISVLTDALTTCIITGGVLVGVGLNAVDARHRGIDEKYIACKLRQNIGMRKRKERNTAKKLCK